MVVLPCNLLFLSLLLFCRHSSAADKASDLIQAACKASLETSACEEWLSKSGRLSSTATVPQLIQSALGIISENLDKGQTMVQDMLKSSSSNANITKAAKSCVEYIALAKHRVNLTDGAVTSKSLKDGRAWLSAALVYQYDSWTALKYANESKEVAEAMVFFNSSSLMGGSRSTLAFLVNYDISGEKTAAWGPVKTERDGFWETVSGSSGSIGVVPTGMKEDATVCTKGCKYNTVQAAVDAAPENGKRYVIGIRSGVYEEIVRVPTEKKNVVMLGDGMGKTVINGSRHAGQPGMTTYESATVGVMGDGFMASGITFQNGAGPEPHQAVAFRSDSDHSIVQNCEFLGHQDTFYSHGLRQYYKSCRIEGNVDFIFGNSAAVFENCTILVAPRQIDPEKSENNAVTAHGRIDPAQSTGYVFQNCVINGTEAYMALYNKDPKSHKNFLGRPWKEYSRTVFIGCTMEALISAEGWMEWSGDTGLNTLYYGEANNKGAGSDRAKRVSWSSLIPASHVAYYSPQNFIQVGDASTKS